MAPVDKDIRDQILDGQEARQLLENRIFNDAFNQVEELIVGQIKRAGINETALHSHLSVALQMLDAVKQAVVQYVETGNAAETLLAELGETK